MRLRFLRTLGLVAMLTLPATAFAQFGHPLDGQWSGGWGKDGVNRLLMDLDYDGKQIVGVINPGPNAITVKSVTFDYSDPEAWGVKITAEGKDASGAVVPVSIDGTLENLGAYRKVFRGTFTHGSEKDEFTVTRN